jgi:hypothetical protein
MIGNDGVRGPKFAQMGSAMVKKISHCQKSIIDRVGEKTSVVHEFGNANAQTKFDPN